MEKLQPGAFGYNASRVVSSICTIKLS